MPETTVLPEPTPAAGTVVPVAEPDADPEVRRQTGGARRSDVLAVIGAGAASISLTCLLFFQLLPFDGVLGFVVVAYGLFIGLYALLVSFDEDGPTVRDRTAAAIVHSLGFILLLSLVLVVTFTFWSGREALQYLNFYVDDLAETSAGLHPLSKGGILHAIVGTLEQISIALVITVPVGVTCAVFLNEVPGWFSGFVRVIVEAMTALPSIIAGLFVFAAAILLLGLPKSGFAAALAISVMMLPIIIRAADVVLRLVPGTLREASLALGASQWRTVWHVVLPTARSGLTTAVILGTARGVGETSPVLLTAGFTSTLNSNPLRDPQVSLPLLTFDSIKYPNPEMVSRGFGTGAVLMLLVLVLFVLARIVGGRGPGRLSRRQQQARERASRRDQLRYEARKIL